MLVVWSGRRCAGWPCTSSTSAGPCCGCTSRRSRCGSPSCWCSAGSRGRCAGSTSSRAASSWRRRPALLGLNLLGPDALAASANVDRYAATGKVDLAYLARLSDDAVPALARLPAADRAQVLGGAHRQARPLVRREPVPAAGRRDPAGRARVDGGLPPVSARLDIRPLRAPSRAVSARSQTPLATGSGRSAATATSRSSQVDGLASPSSPRALPPCSQCSLSSRRAPVEVGAERDQRLLGVAVLALLAEPDVRGQRVAQALRARRRPRRSPPLRMKTSTGSAGQR